MSLIRIGKELQQYKEKEEYGMMTVALDETDRLRQVITVALDNSAEFTIDLEILHPDDYPFSPPKVSLIASSKPDKLFYKLQQVCPDIVCWRPHDLFTTDGIRLCPKIFEGGEWSPARTVPSSLLKFITVLKKRLQGMSFQEAYPNIFEAIPDLRSTGRTGSAKIVFGANAEGDPTSSNMGPQFILLMDPLYNPEGDESLHIHCYRRDETTYVRLAAPWCFKDPDSWQIMEDLLAQLERKGYEDIKAYQSGISLKMPYGVPIHPYYPLATGCGTSVITPGDYGG